MRKLLLRSFLSILFFFSLMTAFTIATSAVSVAPESCTGADGTIPAVCKEIGAQASSGSNPIVRAIRIAIEILSVIIGIAAVIGILVSGLKMVISNGDSKAFTDARNALFYSLVGVVIVVLAQVIVAFVLSRF